MRASPLSHYVVTLLLGLSSALALSLNSAGLSYVQLSPEQVTASTDVWVHGRVLSATGAQIRKNDFGDTYRDITMKLEVIKSTGRVVPPVITVRSETSFHHGMEPGREVFAAFAHNDDGSYTPHSQLGLYGWIPAGKAVDTRTGPVSSDVYWRWLCGLRYAADTGGQATDDDLDFWETNLTSSDKATASLALDFFRNLSVAPVPASEIFEIFCTEYISAEAATPEYQQVQHPKSQHLEALAANVAKALVPHDPNVVATLVLDFYEHAAARPQVLNPLNLDDAFLPLVHHATDATVLARIPEVYDNCIRPNYTAYTMLPTAPSEALDAWLWDIVFNPQAHKVGEESQLVGVWNALANRKNKDLALYLKKVRIYPLRIRTCAGRGLALC